MIRNFGWTLARNLNSAADEFAFAHYHGALYYLRQSRTFAAPGSELEAWLDAAEAFVLKVIEREAEEAEAGVDAAYEAAMREAELGW